MIWIIEKLTESKESGLTCMFRSSIRLEVLQRLCSDDIVNEMLICIKRRLPFNSERSLIKETLLLYFDLSFDKKERKLSKENGLHDIF